MRTAPGMRRQRWNYLMQCGLQTNRFREGTAARNSMHGFSLLELLIAISILIVATLISVMSLQPALKQARVNNGYNTVLGALRQARDISVNQRAVYIASFIAPNTITITQGDTGIVTNTYTLPSDITFHVEPGIPNSSATTPDHFGTGTTAIDFDQNVSGGVKTQIYFQPDGSAQDVNSNLNNGVVYLGRPGDLYSSRAITVWGATSRLRGWRLYSGAGGANAWRKQ